ncbi:MAG: CARDB domain-containing protein [Planctomycetota bacterium]|nr:CARDB domain-containing protein [Planctomycetota bacterium]
MVRFALLSSLVLALLAAPAFAAPKGQQPPPKQPLIFKQLFQPNLVIEVLELTEQPGGVIQGRFDFPELRIRVRNKGIMPAAPSLVAAWGYVDGIQTPLVATPVPMLMGGGSYEVTVPLGEVAIDTEQSYVGAAYADLLDHVGESDENDNFAMVSATL